MAIRLLRKEDMEMECEFVDPKIGKGVCKARQILSDGTAVPVADFEVVKDDVNQVVWVLKVRGRGPDPKRQVKLLQDFAREVWNIPSVKFRPELAEE